MHQTPEVILDKMIDVAVYILDQAEARRRQRGQGGAAAPLPGRLPADGVTFDMPAPSAKAEPLLLKAPEVAALLGISSRQVYYMAHYGELPRVKLGKSLRFPRDELMRWIAEHEG
jgi:excisionase family DNA binding protein